MSPLVLGPTVALLAIPAALIVARALGGRACLDGGGPVVLAIAYAIVWALCRPTRFELTPAGLCVVWPLRRRSVPWAEVADARALATKHDVRAALGRSVRVGVGGLFGGFGWATSSRLGWIDLYVSRTDRLVLIEHHGRRPLLISPADPDGFVRSVRAQCGPAPRERRPEDVRHDPR